MIKIIIPDYARGNFIINENDTPEQISAKQYYLNRERIDRQFEAELQLAKLNKQLQEVNKRIQDFTEKYREIKKMKGKSTIEQLEFQLAIEELIGENQ